MKTILTVTTIFVLCFSGIVLAGINNPIAHWTFDEGTGVVAHDSAGSNDGVIFGAKWTTAGKIGGALDFDGIDDFVNCGENAYVSGSQITVSAWVKSEVTGTDNQMHRIIARWQGYSSNDSFELCYDGRSGHRGFYFELKANQSNYTGYNPPIVHGEWYFVTGVYDGTNVKIYLNGEFKNSIANSGNINQGLRETLIGKDHASWNSCFNGLIDDVRIYDHALSANEVYQLYIPEPVSMVLFAIGSFVVIGRRK